MSSHTVTPRRGFLARIATVAAAAGLSPLIPSQAEAAVHAAADPALEAWFAKIKGNKHKQVFDAPHPNDGLPAIYPRVYMNTMDGTYHEGALAVVILRHSGLPLAIGDAMWAKYKFGEMFDIKDGTAPATRNVYAKIDGLPIPGLGISELIKSGALVGACDVAMTINSSMAAAKTGQDPAVVKKEWIDNMLPGVQLVPSGVFAVGRSQELGCTYCFAG